MVYSSSPSALAKWVKIPSGSRWGRAHSEAISLAAACGSWSSTPKRLMPVSTFKWTRARFPAAPAAADKAFAASGVNTVWATSSATTSSASAGWVNPRTRMGASIPAPLSAAASSRQATAR